MASGGGDRVVVVDVRAHRARSMRSRRSRDKKETTKLRNSLTSFLGKYEGIPWIKTFPRVFRGTDHLSLMISFLTALGRFSTLFC